MLFVADVIGNLLSRTTYKKNILLYLKIVFSLEILKNTEILKHCLYYKINFTLHFAKPLQTRYSVNSLGTVFDEYALQISNSL